VCMVEYDYLPEPVPTMDCFCKPNGCEAWDRTNLWLENITFIVLLAMLFGAVAFALLRYNGG
jgi:hypothetical protein